MGGGTESPKDPIFKLGRGMFHPLTSYMNNKALFSPVKQSLRIRKNPEKGQNAGAILEK